MRIIDNGIYRDATANEIAELESYAPSPEERIAELKSELAETDYKLFKYLEGWISAQEYEPIRQHRQEIRDEINRLEASVDV